MRVAPLYNLKFTFCSLSSAVEETEKSLAVSTLILLGQLSVISSGHAAKAEPLANNKRRVRMIRFMMYIRNK